jgi:DNA-binding response OmpR family regulator
MRQKFKKILVIDDDENLCSAVKRGLEFFGKYHVSVAGGGKAGLKASRKLIPDLILLDILMPDLDGLSVLKKLRQGGKTRFIPVVMLTAVRDQEAKEKASYQYAEQYVTKPFEINKLESVIARTLSRPRHFL